MVDRTILTLADRSPTTRISNIRRPMHIRPAKVSILFGLFRRSVTKINISPIKGRMMAGCKKFPGLPVVLENISAVISKINAC